MSEVLRPSSSIGRRALLPDRSATTSLPLIAPTSRPGTPSRTHRESPSLDATFDIQGKLTRKIWLLEQQNTRSCRDIEVLKARLAEDIEAERAIASGLRDRIARLEERVRASKKSVEEGRKREEDLRRDLQEQEKFWSIELERLSGDAEKLQKERDALKARADQLEEQCQGLKLKLCRADDADTLATRPRPVLGEVHPNTPTPTRGSQELVQASGTTVCSPHAPPTNRFESTDFRWRELEARNQSLQEAFQQLNSKYNEDKRHWKEWKRAEEARAERKKQKKARTSDITEQSPVTGGKQSSRPLELVGTGLRSDHASAAAGPDPTPPPSDRVSTSPNVDSGRKSMCTDAQALPRTPNGRSEQTPVKHSCSPAPQASSPPSVNLHDHPLEPLPYPDPPAQSSVRPMADSANLSPEQRVAQRLRLSKLTAKEKQTLYASYKGKGRYLPPEAVHKTVRDEYEIDPDKNEGVGYQFHEVKRRKLDRKQMHGGDCECCRDYYEAIGPLPKFNEAPKWKDGSPSPNRQGVKEHQQQVSRHREVWERPPTPPGYWNIGFPTTQDVVEQNRRADEMADEKEAKLRMEAMRSGGKWRKKQ